MGTKSQNGGALLEFVVVLPLLLILVAGAVDFGMLFYNKQVLTNASREGARAGIVLEEDETVNKVNLINDIVTAYCEDRLLNDEGTEIAVTTAGPSAWQYPEDLTVTVTLSKYKLLLSPLLNIMKLSTGHEEIAVSTISASTTMRME